VGGNPRREGWRSVLSTLAILIAAPLIALLLINFVFQSYEVDGASMMNTLENRDRLIISKIPRSWARLTGNAYLPHRGDIIIFNKDNLYEFGESGEKQLIKRVIGLPGDRVVVHNEKITVYNSQHPEGFNPDDPNQHPGVGSLTSGAVDIMVGPNEVFVCGDNRGASLDSRSFGAVPAKDIVGKLLVRFLPLNKAEKF
jgi:signal peptidase I